MNQDSNTVTESSQKRLLIIDDEENMRHMLTTLLKRSGYLTDTASDGRKGLQMGENRVQFLEEPKDNLI